MWFVRARKDNTQYSRGEGDMSSVVRPEYFETDEEWKRYLAFIIPKFGNYLHKMHKRVERR